MKPKYNFKLRIHQSSSNSCLYSLRNITISNITIIDKYGKFQAPVITKNAQKFGYSVNIKGKFAKVGGSNTYPCITFKPKYIEIEIKNFPRFPAFAQDRSPFLMDINSINLTFGYFTERIEILEIIPIKT